MVKRRTRLSPEERAEKLRIRQEDVRQEKFSEYNAKYINMIKGGIENVARRGGSEKYINFDRNEFKANCFGLGNPTEFQRAWFDEICNPDSIYLHEDEDGVKISFEGFTFEQLPNAKFTTKITW